MNFIYQEEGFKTVIENHLLSLKNIALNRNSIVKVEPAEAHKYDYDYYNLLRYKDIDYNLHWITARINDIVNPNAKCEHVRSIIVPPGDEVHRLYLQYSQQKEKQI